MTDIPEAVGPPERDEREVRFEAVYRATAASVYAYLLRRGAGDAADDLVDDVYLVVWRRLEEVPREPLPWLLGVARRTLANERRSRDRHRSLVARLELDAGNEDTGPAESLPVLEALERLRPADRELLLLVAWDGLSTGEAARVVRCSAVAARVRLHRARRRLASALAVMGNQPSWSATSRSALGVRPREETR